MVNAVEQHPRPLPVKDTSPPDSGGVAAEDSQLSPSPGIALYLLELPYPRPGSLPRAALT